MKKVTAIIKLQCPAGKANPAPPVGLPFKWFTKSFMSDGVPPATMPRKSSSGAYDGCSSPAHPDDWPPWE